MNQFLAALILACPALTILSITAPAPIVKAHIIRAISTTTNHKACTPNHQHPNPRQSSQLHHGRAHPLNTNYQPQRSADAAKKADALQTT